MINTWTHGKNNANPEQEAMHNFILNVLDLKNGYLGKLFENINQAIARDWFDNIFLDEKWNISLILSKTLDEIKKPSIWQFEN